MTRVLLTLIGATFIGCVTPGETKDVGDAAAPAVSATSLRTRAAPQASTRKEQPALAEGDVRVPLIVLPGDAHVEVDGVPVRRRNGAVELVGKVGSERRVRVSLETGRTEEKIVKIEATGTSPASIDANAPSFVK